MQTYTQMKDSGVAWLGEIPAEWQMLRIGQLFSQRNEKVSDKDFEPLSVTKKGIVPQLEDAAKTDNGDNRKKVLKGDYVINSRSDRKGSSGLSKLDGSVSLINTVLAEGKLYPRFAHHLLRSYPFQEEFYRWGQGIVADLWSTNYQRMKSIQLPVPDYETQERIANYLDEETALIDDLIAKQQRLLTLLEEKRRATITHAVTRGLDPSVEFKETGIPWLGQIPAHWALKKLKNTVTSQKNGVWGSDADGSENDINCIRVADFDRYNLSVSVGNFTKRSIEEKDRQGRLLSKGDLLLEKSGGGDNQLVGQIVKFDSDKPAVTSNFVARVVPASGYNIDFLVFLNAGLYYQRVNYRSIKQTSGIQNIDSQAYFSEMVGIPSPEEQEFIAEHLLKENRLVEVLNQNINKQISLLKERRTSLISHAVTGKIKV